MGIINLSSQSVYGGSKTVLGDEKAPVEPGYLYALAKYGSEELLKQAVHFSDGGTVGCNIRMASLMGPSDMVPDNVLSKFIRSAMAGKTITIVGGTQKFSFLDVRDAAQAIVGLLKWKPAEWEETYNLGPERQTGITEMAELVRDEVLKGTGNAVEITVHTDNEHNLNAGMDSSLMYGQLDWKPPHDFQAIVHDTVCFIAGRG